jgi:hypothetical protein
MMRVMASKTASARRRHRGIRIAHKLQKRKNANGVEEE